MGHLIIARRPNEGVWIEDVFVKVLGWDGNRAKLWIVADPSVRIIRDELVPDRVVPVAKGKARKPKFDKVWCSECGCEFGPRDSGYSKCSDHIAEGRKAVAS